MLWDISSVAYSFICISDILCPKPLETEWIRALFVCEKNRPLYSITLKLPDGPCVKRLRQPV